MLLMNKMTVKTYLTVLSICLCCLMLKQANAQLILNDLKWEYGVKTSLNFNTIGASYGTYNGAGMWGAGLFIQTRIFPQVDLSIEPGFLNTGMRQKQSDTRYRTRHIELPLIVKVDPWDDDAVFFFGGIRPTYLLGYSSEIFTNGAYKKIDLAENKNKQGQFDLGIMFGSTIRLSPVVSIDFSYTYSLTNYTNSSEIAGMPSLIEATLKINAVDLKEALDSKNEAIKTQINNFKQGALLVMLPTISKKETLKYKSEEDLFYALNELKIRNTRVVNEFNRYYNFNKLYFFYDTTAYRIASGNTEGIFLNNQLLPDSSINIASLKNTLVASFCNDISNYSQRFGFGLFVYDINMTQLGKPYNVPSQMFSLFAEGDPINYFKTRKVNYTNLPFDRVIKKFNGRLFRYSYTE